MDSVGERLKKARLEKKISLEEASRKTRIHLYVLEALEEDRLINQSPVYLKGFLKIYCDFLKLDTADFISDFKKPQAGTDYLKAYQKPILPKPSVSLSNFRPSAKMIPFLAIIAVLFIFGFTVFKIAKSIKERRPAVILEKKKKEPPLITAKEINSSDTLRLSVRAKENCWIKARVDGKVVFADVLRKGRFESWQAKEKIEMSLGNAGGVEMQLNDKLISTLGRKGQVIKQIQINKEEGLKVIR